MSTPEEEAAARAELCRTWEEDNWTAEQIQNCLQVNMRNSCYDSRCGVLVCLATAFDHHSLSYLRLSLRLLAVMLAVIKHCCWYIGFMQTTSSESNRHKFSQYDKSPIIQFAGIVTQSNTAASFL